MIAAWKNHLWQSTVFAVAAGLLTLAFRGNRASVRFGLWCCASFKFLIPFAVLLSLGSHLQWKPAARNRVAPAVSVTVLQLAEPFPVAVAPPTRFPRNWVPVTISALWVCGFLGVALIRFRGWRRVRAAVRASVPIRIGPITAVNAVAGLPGRHSWIDTYPAGENQTINVPLQSFPAGVIIHGAIRSLAPLPPGVNPMMAFVDGFNFYLGRTNPDPVEIERENVRLRAGSYVCSVIVQDQSSGQIYGETINFEIK